MDVGGWRLAGVALYWGIPFEIMYGISVLRLSWVQWEGISIYRGELYQGLTVYTVKLRFSVPFNH
jgi:hypothetical protein